MVRQEVWMDVKLMHRQGHSLRQIARMTGLSRVTVRRILSAAAPKGYGPRAQRPGKLAAFVAWLEARLSERPRATASWLHRGLLAEGFGGSYTTVKRWAHERRREERARARACVRFETAPGLEGQFDWKGPVAGLIAAAPELGVHFFRFVLAWSRARWTLVVPDLRLPATLAALRWAFERAGGIPYRLVLDNPKTCVSRPRPHLPGVLPPLRLRARSGLALSPGAQGQDGAELPGPGRRGRAGDPLREPGGVNRHPNLPTRRHRKLPTLGDQLTASVAAWTMPDLSLSLSR